MTLQTQVYVKPGELMVRADEPQPRSSTKLEANLFWLSPNPMVMGKRYKLKLHATRAAAYLTAVHTVIDASDLTTVANRRQIERHDVAHVTLETLKPVACDLAVEIPQTGRFVIIDDYEIAGGGVILSAEQTSNTLVLEHVRQRNQAWVRSRISPQERAGRHGQRPALVVICGPQGGDMESLGRAIEEHLHNSGRLAYYLGLSNQLLGLNADLNVLGGREEYLRRLGETAHLFTDAGLIVITTIADLDDFELETIGHAEPAGRAGRGERRRGPTGPAQARPRSGQGRSRRPVRAARTAAGEAVHSGLPDMRFSTKAIRVGQQPDPTTGSIIVPVYQTVNFTFHDVGQPHAYEYSRSGNPTRTALEQCLAALEEARFGLAFSSGMAAVDAVLSLLRPGDHVVSAEHIYGGTFRLFEQVYRPRGVSFTYVDGTRPEAFAKATQPMTKLVWIETPANPLLQLVDVRAVAKIAHDHGAKLVADNTFPSPYFQRPLTQGADIVLHSTTKYVSGHSDVIGGAVVTSDDRLHEAIKFHQNAAGAVPGPWDCWLSLRGLKTLAVRMKQHEANARAVAEFLEKHPKVQETIYPGLPSHPQHELAKRRWMALVRSSRSD